jgi:hypothetical protein
MSQRKDLEAEAEDDYDFASPIAILLYEMLMEPTVNRYGIYYYVFLCAWIIIRVIAMGLETLDGPNQYYKRDKDLSIYPNLLTHDQYFSLYTACMVPLLLDSFLRLILLGLITVEPENYAVFRRFKEDKICWHLLFADLASMVPYIATAAYIYPKNVQLIGGARATLALIELMITARIFRFFRHVPSIRVITRAVSRSVEHLILPLFFFIVFNITTGVIFYFAEPCYRISTCPWVDLFEATFYSVVTMTTSKYITYISSYICAYSYSSIFI